MINIVEPLLTSRFTSADFTKNTVLNTNVTTAQVCSRISESVRGNVSKRKNSKARAHRSTKY